jgi:hypothetical protein
LTAADLIAALRELAPETRIVTEAKGGRVTTIIEARLIAIVRDPHRDPWDGDYSEAEPPGQERALLIGRAVE